MKFGEIYTNIFKLILVTINSSKCSNFETLLSEISNDNSVIELRNIIGDDKSIAYIQDVLDKQLDLNLVIGNYNSVKYYSGNSKIYNLQRLSPEGYMYLDELSKPNFWNKFKAHAKENGVSPTPENISKFVANCLWD